MNLILLREPPHSPARAIPYDSRVRRRGFLALAFALPLSGGLAEEPSRSVDLTNEIAEVADGARAPDALSLRLDWLREGRMTTAEIHGRGVGIWNGRTQLVVSRADVLALARALRSSGFGAMPSTFGEGEAEEVARM